MDLLQFPLVKVTISFIFGLLVALYFDFDLSIGVSGILCSILFLLLTYFFVKNKLVFGIIVCVTALWIGILAQILHQDILNQKHYLHAISEDKQHVNLTLDSKLKPNAYNHRFYAKVNSIDNQKSYGTLLINLSKEVYTKESEIGTRFEVFSKVIPNSVPRNPRQFDYGKYLERQKVYAQIYTDSTNNRIVSTDKTLKYYTHKIRNRILENLRKSGFSEDELTVLHALILGQQQDISPEILQAYQYAGAVHILSVSGLHVAYIYLFLNFVLKLIPNHKKGRLFKLLILLLSLWGFALLAGMAPAIVRAVTMFSFVSIGAFLNRNTNIIYTLLISMLFILLCNPSFLFDVGFQLSYLALFFIVWTKPMMDTFYQPTNKIKKYVWDVVTVSLAAQIGVLPLSLFYFNQFPTLFIITNLLVLFPLSIFMIYGVILSIMALFGITNFYLSKIMEYGIKYINEVSFRVAKYESFVFTDVSFNVYMLVGWYVIIFTFFIWLNNRKFISLVFLFSGIIFLQTIYILNKIETINADEFIVYNKSRTTLLSDRKANKISVFTNDSITEQDYLLRSYKVGSFSSIVKTDSLQNVYYSNNKKILVIDNSSVYGNDMFPDVVLLSGSPKLNLERFLHHYKPEIIIADASNYKSYVHLWKQSCEKHKIHFHSTYENGFYKITNNR